MTLRDLQKLLASPGRFPAPLLPLFQCELGNPQSCRKLGLRVGPEMAEYVRKQSAQGGAEIPIIAADARTGLPVQTTLPAETLRELMVISE